MGESEEFAKPLTAAAATIPSAEMLEKLDKGDEMAQAAKDSIAKARDVCTAMAENISPELKSLLAKESDQLENRHKRLDMRVSALAAKLLKFRDETKKKEVVELENLKEAALKMLRYHACVKKLSNDELFIAIDKNRDGRIEEGELLKFFQTCEKLPAADAKKEETKDEGEVR